MQDRILTSVANQQAVLAPPLIEPDDNDYGQPCYGMTQSWWWFGHWDGKYKFVPQDFVFPEGVPVRSIWDLFFFGDFATKIRPYRLIKKCLIRKYQPMHSRAEHVIKGIIINGRSSEMDPRYLDCCKMNRSDLDLFFDRAWNKVKLKLGWDTDTRSDISYVTVYNRMIKKDRIFRIQQLNDT